MMSHSTPSGNAPPADASRSFWATRAHRIVLDFFFRPTDPTTLGLIRIVAGILILYTHLAYSYDLGNFFGPNAWYNTASINRERREVPSYAAPLTWEDAYEPTRMAQLPEAVHRRSVIVEYTRQLVREEQTPAALDQQLNALILLNNQDLAEVRQREGDASNAIDGLNYVAKLAMDATDRANQLAVLVDESLLEAKQKTRIPELPIPTPPRIVRGMTVEERSNFAKSLETFYKTLPSSVEGQAYVLAYWREMDFGQRTATIQFLRNLIQKPVPQRQTDLEYWVYWNVDRDVLYREGAPIFSLWFHLTEPWELVTAHSAMLLVMVMFTVGLYTRVTSVLTWLAILTYIHRCQQTLFGMDTMMNITMIYLMIGNSGAALSVDRLRQRAAVVRMALANGRGFDASVLQFLAAPPPSVSAGFALKLLQIHFCFIYMAAGLSKLKGVTWWNTTAYWDTLVNPEFTMIYYRWYEDTLRWFIGFRPLYAVMAAGAIAYTFIAEISLPFLVWTRLRPYIMMMAVGLHFGVGAFMGLVVFSLFMMTMLLSYLPGTMIRRRLFPPVPEAERWTLRYPGTEASSLAMVRRWVLRDELGRFHWERDDQLKGVQLVRGSTRLEGAAAVEQIERDLPRWSLASIWAR